MKPFLLLLGVAMMLLLAASCVTPPTYLNDDTIIPPGSKVSFWVLHDKHGWVESNIHVVTLPRMMSGVELRLWAEGVGRRDAGMRWTAFYALVTLPGSGHRTLRTEVVTITPDMLTK